MHPIKRGILVVLLSLGAIGGFTHGFARMAQCHSSCGMSRREQFEQHIADVCTRSAERVHEEREEQRPHHRHGMPPRPPQGQLVAPPGYAWTLVPVAAPPAPATAPDTDTAPAAE